MKTVEPTAAQIKALKDYKCIPRDVALQVINVELLQKWQGEQSKTKAAGILPLPGNTSAAFPVMGQRIKSFTVRPCKAGDYAILQKLDSPLLKQLEESLKDESQRNGIKIEVLDMVVAVFCFTRPCVDVYQMIEKEGADAIKLKAIKEIGEVDMEILGEMFAASQGQLCKSFDTVVQYSGESKKNSSQDSSTLNETV